jgi:hypothetical protein
VAIKSGHAKAPIHVVLLVHVGEAFDIEHVLVIDDLV